MRSTFLKLKATCPLLKTTTVNVSHLSDFSAVYYLILPPLALLIVPTAVVASWAFEQTLLASAAFGRESFGELALPLGACIFAALVFLVPNPMHSLISLLGVFFTTVLFYLLGGIIFVGFTFLIVYVGAVAILFLFVIMLLNAKSLTAREELIRHSSQYAVLAAISTLLQELYLNTLSALERVLNVGNWRVATMEGTSGDAVTFYVRYGSADINALTALYTVHTPLFLLTVALLLVSLVGALILATMTTERPVSTSDLLKYTTRLLNSSPRMVAAAGAPAVLGACAAVCSVVSFNTVELCGVTVPLFMSFYEPLDHKNKHIIDGQMGGCDTYQVKRVVYPKQFVAPQFLAWDVKRTCVLPLDSDDKEKNKNKKSKSEYVSPEQITKDPYRVFEKINVGPIRKFTKRYWGRINWNTPTVRGMRDAKRRTKVMRGQSIKILKTDERLQELSVKLRVHMVLRMQRSAQRVSFKRYCRVVRGLAYFAAVKARGLSPRKRKALLRRYRPVGLTGTKIRAIYCQLYKLRSELRRRGRKRSVRRHHWFWHWRSERATSLIRIRRRNLNRSVKFKRRRKWHQRLWRAKLVKLASPFTLERLGLRRYLNFLYRVQIVPELLVWAWRIRAFCSAFCYYLILIPLVLTPIPWFLNDMDIAWHDITYVWRSLKFSMCNGLPLFASLPNWLVNIFAVIFFYPAAAWKLLFSYPWSVMAIAAIYAYDVVLYAGGMLPKAEGHESECNYFRLSYEDVETKLAKLRWEAGHAGRVRHPDKGRTDLWFILLACPANIPYAKYALYLAAYLEPLFPYISLVFFALQLCVYMLYTGFMNIISVLLELQRYGTAALCGIWTDIGPTVMQSWANCVSFAYWITDPAINFYRTTGSAKLGPDPVAFVLLILGLGFILSSLFISRYWTSVYVKDIPKLPLPFVLVALLAWTYCLIVYLRCGVPLNVLFNLSIPTFKEAYDRGLLFDHIFIYSYLLLALFAPYFLYRRLFTEYWWMPRYRLSVVRRSINDYFKNIRDDVHPTRMFHDEVSGATSREDTIARIAAVHAKRKERIEAYRLKHGDLNEWWPTKLYISHDPHPQKEYFNKYWPLQVALPYRPRRAKRHTMW
jgi:NADH:ubiquinone oxidoreductase subunit 6 (subunit J)